MIKYNLLLFFRNIKKYRKTFLINLVGMSTGLACTLLIALWVVDELQMDRFHEKGEHLVQVFQNFETPNGIETEDATQGPLAKALIEEYPEVNMTATVLGNEWFEGEKFLLSDGGDQFFSSKIQFASEDYFLLFSFPLLYGNPETALKNIDGVVISEELAKKLFGTTDVVGRNLDMLHDEYGGSYTVSGVFKNVPKNSTEQFDAIFNLEVFITENEDLWEWGDSDAQTYAVLASNTNLFDFNSKIERLLESKIPGRKQTYFAQPYGERYLYGNYANGKAVGGRIQYVLLFSVIALLILIIACVNFVNMATAKASLRIKEIGVKKSVGAHKRNLLFQFTNESLIMAAISMLVALVIAYFILPAFNEIAGKQLGLSLGYELGALVFLITLFTGLIAGFYPAVYLSGLPILQGLKGKLTQSNRNGLARKGLVVFQFSSSVILLVAVFVVYKQLAFIQGKSLGFDREHVIFFSSGVLESDIATGGGNADTKKKDIAIFLEELRNIPGVMGASNFRHNMMADFGTTTGMDWTGKEVGEEALFAQVAVGYEFIETMRIKMDEGRSFSQEFGSEDKKIVLNEAAIEVMGIEGPIGKRVTLWGEQKEIIGVAKNFHIDKLYKKVLPVFMTLSDSDFASNIMVRLHPRSEKSTLEQIEKAYKAHFVTGMPFEFRFLNNTYQDLYSAEQRVASLSKYFAVLAILISCLGLFGLSIFVTEKRKKEIGIRKVLGQSSLQIARMLSKELIKLVGLSILIALPIAYVLASDWLSGYAYRIPLKFVYFLLAGGIALLIALASVGGQTLNAAGKNPMNALREE